MRLTPGGDLDLMLREIGRKEGRELGCWNIKRRQPDSSTSLHLCISGFSRRRQFMTLGTSPIPCISSLSTWFYPFCSFPSLYPSYAIPFHIYLVMLISRPSDVVPHTSATSEMSKSYSRYFVLYHVDHVHSYHIYRFRRTRFSSRSHGT